MAGMRNPLCRTWRWLFKRPGPPLDFRSTLDRRVLDKPAALRRRKTDRWKA
jgi:hypothetical protein